jgi:hypothetical protein
MDVEIEPGKTYQYRMRIVMTNPNYGLKEGVASDKYAEEAQLRSEWYVVPQKAAVPPEMTYYAVDQRELDNPKNPPTLERGQMALQIHQWLKFLDAGENEAKAVGEWVVAERMLVKRGEYVGRTVKVDVPIWKFNNEAFVLAGQKSDPTPMGTPPPKSTGYPVKFGYSINDTLLIDFEGGADVTHEGAREKGKTTFREKAPVEALLFTHEGKLIQLDGALDGEDKERRQRLGDYKKRVEEVKKSQQKTGPSKDGPFGPRS